MSAERAQPSDIWAKGAAYEPYVGRWSRLVAREFIFWLAAPPGSRWLDVGCGTGALTETILAFADPSHATGIDASDGYIAFARQAVRDSRADFQVGDAQSLPLPPASYDVAVSGLVLNFIPDPNKAVAEMARVVHSGGTVAAYVWDYAEGMQLMRFFWDAVVTLDPEAAALDEGIRFPLCSPAPLEGLLRNAGMQNVQVRAINVPTVFRDFDDYWTPFLGGQGPAPSYVMALPEDRRVALRERVRADLPIGPDGSIHLIARAWAAKGLRQR